MTVLDHPEKTSSQLIQLVTFRCGELLIGLDLTAVQEINRHSSFTDVPEAPPQIRGVINLRGEVITMLDLQVVLNQTQHKEREATHNVFVHNNGEVIGLVTDGVSDIVTIAEEDIDPSPANIKDADSTLFRGVYTMEDNQLVVILDLTQALNQNALLS